MSRKLVDSEEIRRAYRTGWDTAVMILSHQVPTALRQAGASELLQAVALQTIVALYKQAPKTVPEGE